MGLVYDEHPIELQDQSRIIRLGIWDTYNVQSVSFNIAPWIEKYGTGDLIVLHERPNEGVPFEVDNVEIQDGIATWTFSAFDTARAGTGSCALIYTVDGDFRARTAPWQTRIIPTIGPQGETPPDPLRTWYDDIMAASAAAVASKDAAAGSASAAGENATQAAGSASAAGAAKDAAQAAQQAAEAARDAAAGSASAAAGSAEQAAGSATAAGAAKDSAQAAQQAAEAARDAAAGSASAAAGSAEQAAGSANAAGTAKDAAQAAQQAAEAAVAQIAALDAISVTPPAKRYYASTAEPLDLTGMAVTAAYTNGASYARPLLLCESDPADGAVFDSTGMKTVTVTYRELGVSKTDSFAVSVAAGPVITQQPVDFVGDIGDTATFHVEAQGGALSYQWMFDSGRGWVQSTQEGARTPTLLVEMTEARLDYRYRCRITGDDVIVHSDVVQLQRIEQTEGTNDE